MPLSEALSPDRAAHVKEIQEAARHFKFRGQPISCQLNLQVSVEGGGLYAGHSALLRSQGLVPEDIDVPVLMGGERNTSLIVYRAGKLNPLMSSSTAGGFYKYANLALQSLGAQADLSHLIEAIATGETHIRVAGNEVVDISVAAQNARRLYSEHLVNLIRAKLPTGKVNVVCGGGALYMAWDSLKQWFAESNIHASYMGPLLERDLEAVFARQRRIEKQQIRRFADAVGMYRVLSTSTSRTPVGTR